jgi:hypothetical protein
MDPGASIIAVSSGIRTVMLWHPSPFIPVVSEARMIAGMESFVLSCPSYWQLLLNWWTGAIMPLSCRATKA